MQSLIMFILVVCVIVEGLVYHYTGNLLSVNEWYDMITYYIDSTRELIDLVLFAIS